MRVKMMIALMLATIPIKSQPQHKPLLVTITYDGDEVKVSPKLIHLNIGDTVQYWAPRGEFVLTFSNPFNDKGWKVTSTSGLWTSPTANNRGRYHVDCELIIDGNAIDAEYGGETEVGN